MSEFVFTFSAAQRAELLTLRDGAREPNLTPAENQAFIIEAYERILEILETPIVPPPDEIFPTDDPNAASLRGFIQGALRINSDSDAFATLFREYTHRLWELKKMEKMVPGTYFSADTGLSREEGIVQRPDDVETILTVHWQS